MEVIHFICIFHSYVEQKSEENSLFKEGAGLISYLQIFFSFFLLET